MNPFLGSLMLVPFGFAPAGWALCQGQLMPISQNTALFSLLGTTYGGNGTSNFALPDLLGRVTISSGQGPGLQLYDLGELGGVEAITLLQSEIPAHTHSIVATNGVANLSQAANNVPAKKGIYLNPPAFDAALAASTLQSYGGSLPHNNMMPTITLSWIIALQGVFPSRP